jgi:hypothetical protein
LTTSNGVTRSTTLPRRVASQIAKKRNYDHEKVNIRTGYCRSPATLLNEFLKEHRTVQELKQEIAALHCNRERAGGANTGSQRSA